MDSARDTCTSDVSDSSNGGEADERMLRRLYYYGNADADACAAVGAPEVQQQLRRYLRDSTLTPYCARSRLMGSCPASWSCDVSEARRWRRRPHDEAGATGMHGIDDDMTTAAAARAHNELALWPRHAQPALPPLSSPPPPPPLRVTQRAALTHVPTHTRAPRTRRAHSLFGAPRRRGSSRYRAIADLELYMATGVLNERTLYFADAMQRRDRAAGDGGDGGPLAPPPSQCVLSLDTAADPRTATLPWQQQQQQPSRSRPASPLSRADAPSSRVRITDVVPRRALLLKYNFEQTTGMVKPYAMGTSYHAGGTAAREAAAAAGHALDHGLHESSMHAYVAAMRCHRPTKGVYALH